MPGSGAGLIHGKLADVGEVAEESQGKNQQRQIGRDWLG
jgi:hypothetical protein